jgi:hypothetical protein
MRQVNYNALNWPGDVFLNNRWLVVRSAGGQQIFLYDKYLAYFIIWRDFNWSFIELLLSNFVQWQARLSIQYGLQAMV